MLMTLCLLPYMVTSLLPYMATTFPIGY